MKFDLLAAASVPLPTKNIENNPMHSREPLAKKGVKKGGRWHGCRTRKNILTRRANQGHSLIIPQSCVRPSLRNRGRAGCDCGSKSSCHFNRAAIEPIGFIHL